MKCFLTYCLLLLIIPLATKLNGQANLAEPTQVRKPSELLQQYMLNHPNENFVIQTDRDLYFSGTELWFSVWSLDDQTLSPFSYSGIIYLELMDKNGESMVQQILKLDKNKASGKIVLPEDITSGTFYLQAYSNLQRNFGEHLFGIKIIQVINPSKPPVRRLTETLQTPLVSVFPEGQRLIRGCTNKLVIKATYPNGQYVDLTNGLLISQPGDTIAELEFLMPGMGYCSFFADTSHTYHLDLPGFDTIPLEIRTNGFSLNVKRGESELLVTVQGKGTPEREKYYLVGKIRGEVFYEQEMEQGMEELKLPYSSLPGGLLEFTLLNSGFEAYSQRLYYHDISTEPLSSDIVFRKSSFEKGERIDMDILLPEKKKFELLSLSVRKDLFIDNTLNENFKSCVDLHPFLNDWDEIEQLLPEIPAGTLDDFLDLYLITMKSSRFKWEQIFNELPGQLDFQPEVNFKHMTGYGFNPENSMRIRNDNLVLFFVDREAAILNSRTDSQGKFSFEFPVDKTGTSEVVVQSFGHNDKMDISFDWPFHQSVNDYKLDFFHIDTSRYDEYDRAYAHSVLEKMYKDKEKPVLPDEKRSISFYGIPDTHILLEDYVAMRNMEEVFKELVTGEKIRLRDDTYSLQLYHREKNYYLGENPLILFNGAPALNFREIIGLPVTRVEFVDLVRQHFRMENQLFDGIVNIVAKDLDLQLMIPQNAFKTRVELFSPASHFSRARDSRDTRIPDLNPTLYWNPDLTFEGDNRHISFRAGDNPGRYQVMLRGIDREGSILEVTRYFTIE